MVSNNINTKKTGDKTINIINAITKSYNGFINNTYIDNEGATAIFQ